MTMRMRMMRMMITMMTMMRMMMRMMITKICSNNNNYKVPSQNLRKKKKHTIL